MLAYVIRRLLLIPLTLVGVTLIVFGLTRILPGGPMERAMQAASQGQEGQRAGRGPTGASTLSKDQELELARRFGHDRSFLMAFGAWWGVIRKEENHKDFSLTLSTDPKQPASEPIFLGIRNADGKLESKKGTISLVGENEAKLQLEDGSEAAGWQVRFTTPNELEILEGKKSASSGGGDDEEAPATGGAISKAKHVVVFQPKFAGVLQWNFGYSLNFDDPVWDMIKQRMPVSIFYGLLIMFLTYAVSIPLGIVKALRHRTWLDTITSVLIFIGYAIPGFALGMILVLAFAFRLDWFPFGGFYSDNFRELSAGGKITDIFKHAVLPLICLLLPAFAETTMLMKNSLMDNLSQDYVRTAVAKGSTYRRAVFAHAVRNSIIPIATTFGLNIMLLVSGFLLIEQVFDIPGFGQLTFNALVDRDYPIVMATIFLTSFLMVVGNLISDLLVAAVNPRIRFE